MGDQLIGEVFGNQSTETSSVQELRKWRLFRDLPYFLLRRVKRALISRRQEGEWYEYAFLGTCDDDVYALGDNRSGQLGIPKTIAIANGPIKLEALCGLGIIDFAASWHHAAAWTKDGRLFMMGENKDGELGQGHRNEVPGPHEVIRGLNGEKVIKVVCGGHHTMCLTGSRTVYTWGKNQYYQCGHAYDSVLSLPHRLDFPDCAAKFVDIACTVETSYALTSEGHVYAWGDNRYGQVGVGSRDTQIQKPTKISFPGTHYIKSIACGFSHCMALTTGGFVFTWGKNTHGQLGDGDREPARVPVKVDVMHATSISAWNGLSTSFCKAVPGNLFVWGHFTIAIYPYCTEYEDLNDYLADNNLGMCKTWVAKANPKSAEVDLYTYLVEESQKRTITFEVEGKRVKASKLCLRRCEIMAQKLQQEWKESVKRAGVIKLSGFPFSAFEAFIDFLHTDILSAAAKDLIDLVRLSRIFKMRRFHIEVVKLVSQKISMETAVPLYCLALETNDSALGLATLDFIKPRTAQVFDEINLHEINSEALVRLMQDVKAMKSFRDKNQ